MSPIANTCFGVLLFLALACLLKWSHRRHRLARKYRKTLAAALVPEDEPGRPYLVS